MLSTASGPLQVEDARPMAGDRWIVRFAAVADRPAAEALRGLELEAEPLEVPGTLWVHELVGALVRDAERDGAGSGGRGGGEPGE